MYKRTYTVYISRYGTGNTSTVLIKIQCVTFISISFSLFPSLRFEFFSGLTKKRANGTHYSGGVHVSDRSYIHLHAYLIYIYIYSYVNSLSNNMASIGNEEYDYLLCRFIFLYLFFIVLGS